VSIKEYRKGELIKPENVQVKMAKNAFHFSWDQDKTNIGSQIFIVFKDVLSDAVSKSVYCGKYTSIG